MICPLCDSDHCPETNMDNTIGCCLCYNKLMKETVDEIITLCEACLKWSKGYQGYGTFNDSF